MIDIKDHASKNLFGASNPADLLLCRSMGVYSADEQNIFLTNGSWVCEQHLNEILKKWKTFSYKHFDHQNQSPNDSICSFPSIDQFNNLHTRRTKIKGNDLPELTKQQAEFMFVNYGVLLHPGLRKINFYF